MIKMRIRLLVLLAVLVLGGTMVTSAQDDNKLINGGLEEGSFGPYTGRRGGTFPIYLPNGWNYWFAAPTSDRTNVGERTSIQPHPGPGPSPHGGSRALNISCGYFTCTTAIYQTVGNIQAGTNVQATAWSQIKACNLGGGSSCGSSPASGSETRIGIDPTGGSDPNNPAIVWSAWVTPHDQWLSQSVSATATGTSVTLFLYSTQPNIADLNKTYWDDASLTGGGAGGVAPGLTPAVPPTATPPPYVAFVVPQGAQPDGSIIHTVQNGDTMDSIAYAYGTTRSELLKLNNLQSANFIFPGQKLIVKPPTNAAESTAESTTEATAETTAGQQTGGENVVLSAPTTDTSAPATTPESDVTSVAAVATDIPATTQPTVEPTTELPTTQPTADNSTPLPTNSPEPTKPLATAPVVVANAGALDPSAVTAQVCVLLFDDANQNRIQETGENLLAGGVMSLLKGSDTAGTYTTDGKSEPHCFDKLAAGDYVVAASAPSGYGLTTPDQLRVQLQPGTTINLVFGAAQGVQPVQPPTADANAVAMAATPASSQPPPLANQLLSISGLVVFGLAAVVLIGGIGLAIVLRRR